LFDRATYPHPDVTAFNAGVGFANGYNDDDGVFRHYRLLNFHAEQPIPSLALAAYSAAGDDSFSIEYNGRSVIVDGTEFPINDDGEVVLRFATPGDPEDPQDLPLHTMYSAWDILQSALAVQSGVEPVIDPSELEGKYVLFGLQAAGLLDLRPTPLDPRAPGVTVHATMLDNLLSGEVMQDMPLWATIVILALLTIAGALAATYASKTWLEALLIVGFLAVSIGVGLVGYIGGFWVPMVAVLIAVFVALAASNVANYATEGAARRQIRGMFGRYLSPDVISELEDDPSALELGGKEADITIYFSDIQKFSTISTKLGPDELVGFLNVYLTPMTNAILEEGGLIDKYEGDAIIAMWGAPKERDDHARAGLRSLLKCQAELDNLRPSLKEQIGTEVYQRIGMSTGKATVGNMGSELRTDYTMIGDAVNLAARLEGANKAFGTYSMVSQDTINSTGGLDAVRREVCAVRELGYIAVVGREDKPVRVYEPMPQEQYDTRLDVLAAYQKAITAFQAGEFSEARATFERIANEDPAAASYVPRCEELMKNPPADWSGVWVLTEKG
jgi:adenylate cyclase